MTRPKKRLGQHFLRHRAILARIADALGPMDRCPVVEIGPGEGTLTAALEERGARLTLIEKDPDLIPALRSRFPTARVVLGDALELDWRDAAGLGPADRLLVAGNIPYNVTSPLIDQALRPPRPERIVFLVQKEVAERIVAPAGAGSYGALSVGVQAVAVAERLFNVPAGAFHPPPRVDSAAIRLVPRPVPLVRDGEVPGFRRFVVGLFGARRKQLLRGLRSAHGLDPAAAATALGVAGIPAAARPETLGPEGFVALFHSVVDGGWSPR